MVTRRWPGVRMGIAPAWPTGRFVAPGVSLEPAKSPPGLNRQGVRWGIEWWQEPWG